MQRFIPFFAFLALSLGFWAAINYQPEKAARALQGNMAGQAMPVLRLVSEGRVESRESSVVSQEKDRGTLRRSSPLEGEPHPPSDVVGGQTSEPNTIVTLDPASFQGHTTLINFFASWCVPCAMEMGEMQALHEAFPDLRIIGVAWNDKPTTIRAWLEKNGNPFTQVLYDPHGRNAIAMGLRGVPESFLVDEKGHIVMHLAGSLTTEFRTQKLEPFLKTGTFDAH